MQEALQMGSGALLHGKWFLDGCKGPCYNERGYWRNAVPGRCGRDFHLPATSAVLAILGAALGRRRSNQWGYRSWLGVLQGDNLGLRGGPRRLPVSGVEPAWGRTLAHLHHCQAASAARKSPCRTVAMSKLGVRKVEARWPPIPSLCLPRQALPRQQCGRQASP